MMGATIIGPQATVQYIAFEIFENFICSWLRGFLGEL